MLRRQVHSKTKAPRTPRRAFARLAYCTLSTLAAVFLAAGILLRADGNSFRPGQNVIYFVGHKEGPCWFIVRGHGVVVFARVAPWPCDQPGRTVVISRSSFGDAAEPPYVPTRSSSLMASRALGISRGVAEVMVGRDGTVPLRHSLVAGAESRTLGFCEVGVSCDAIDRSALILLLVWTSWTALAVGRRVRDRYLSTKRCWHCGYDLRGGHSRCPECGNHSGQTNPILESLEKWRKASTDALHGVIDYVRSF